MIKIVLLGLVLIPSLIFVLAVWAVLRHFAPESAADTRKKSPMPMFRKIAYIVLIILLFGVTSGALGMA